MDRAQRRLALRPPRLGAVPLLRASAVEEHERLERLLEATRASGDLTPWQVWAHLALRTRQAMVVSILVAAIAIGLYLR